MAFQTYILYSEKIDRFYIGHTGESLGEIIWKHLSDYRGFTALAKDWKLLQKEVFQSKGEAYRGELQIKRKKSRRYIEIWAGARRYSRY